MHKIYKLCFILLILTFIFPFIILATDDTAYVWSEISSPVVTTSAVLSENEGNFLNLTCGSAILIDQSSGTILYEHNIHEQLRPASVTKIMTVLLIMEALDNGTLSLSDLIPCSENASSMGGSQIWLDTTETLSVDEMLKAICVVSANDYKVQLRHKNF